TADGPAAVPGADAAGDAAPGLCRRGGAAAPIAARRDTRPGDDLPEVPAQGAASPLPQRGSAGRRPGPLAAARADSGPARRARRTAAALVPTAAGAGVAGGGAAAGAGPGPGRRALAVGPGDHGPQRR